MVNFTLSGYLRFDSNLGVNIFYDRIYFVRFSEGSRKRHTIH